MSSGHIQEIRLGSLGLIFNHIFDKTCIIKLHIYIQNIIGTPNMADLI